VRGPHAGAAVPAPPSTGNLEVRILAEGKPVPGVPVQARAVGEPGRDTWVEGTNAAVDTSDARGVVHFRGLAVGGYDVVGHCGRLPGDNIAGTIATRAEVIAGTMAHATLTLRRGGRILGRCLEGETPLGDVRLESEAVAALPSTCPMLEGRNPGPDGRFTVGKIPIGTIVWVKGLRPMGKGTLQVWKDFNLAHAETVTGTWNYPHFDSTQLGTVRIGVRLDEGQPAEGGRLDLTHLSPDGWRYSVGFDFTEAESLTVLPALPPGAYSVRATANATVKTWWSAAADTISVAPGASHTKLVHSKVRR
jgi:hypothetical protein